MAKARSLVGLDVHATKVVAGVRSRLCLHGDQVVPNQRVSAIGCRSFVVGR